VTTSKAREREAGRPGRKARDPLAPTTLADDFVADLRALLEVETTIRWPSPKYRTDPIGFFQDIIGVDPWDVQRKVLRAVCEHERVAWKSGRRVSKSHTVAGLALWWYCSFDEAYAVMSSTTARQVDSILWHELLKMRAKAGRCVRCKIADPSGFKIPAPCPHSAKIDGDAGMLARTGLVSADFRRIKGFTAKEAEAVQGIAGPRLFFFLDEASGIPQPIYEAIDGNRAGGGKVLLTGNPTKNEGEFHDAFHEKRLDPEAGRTVGYFCITTSSEESPNIKAGREVIPGLATQEYIRERELEWGRGSPLFTIHVEGEFAKEEAGRIFSAHAIAEAQNRWDDTPQTGRLFIGLDPAGESGSGDETAFAIRRGFKLLDLIAMRGLNDEQHLVHLLGLIGKYRLPRETPVVVLDREGSIGASLNGKLHAYVELNPGAFELVSVRASDRAFRQPKMYDRVRDELAHNLEAWFRDGGAIVEDARLAKELHALEWDQQVNGRFKVTPKKELKKALGRSPDRYDALALCAWEPLSLREGIGDASPAVQQAAAEAPDRPAIDPYGGMGAFEQR
jgi:phage terminase large subunit